MTYCKINYFFWKLIIRSLKLHLYVFTITNKICFFSSFKRKFHLKLRWKIFKIMKDLKHRNGTWHDNNQIIPFILFFFWNFSISHSFTFLKEETITFSFLIAWHLPTLQNPCCKLPSLAACVPGPNTGWLRNLYSDSQEQTVERPQRGKKGRKIAAGLLEQN